MLLAVSAASVSAQTYQIRKDSVKTGEYSPTVYLVSVNAHLNRLQTKRPCSKRPY